LCPDCGNKKKRAEKKNVFFHKGRDFVMMKRTDRCDKCYDGASD
jgi:hypothetical protein